MNKKNEFNLIFETTDPNYNVVYLTKEKWEKHIVTKRPQMLGTEKIVQAAVEKPDKTTKSPDYDTRYYYKVHGETDLNIYGDKTKVAVDIDTGWVKTSYFVHNIKKDEIQE